MKVICKVLVASVCALSSMPTAEAQQILPQTGQFKTFDTEAHRGGRGLMPENTIPAMLNALKLGVNTLGMDSHITSDGKVIVAHDDYINPAFTLAPGGAEIPVSDKHEGRYPAAQVAGR